MPASLIYKYHELGPFYRRASPIQSTASGVGCWPLYLLVLEDYLVVRLDHHGGFLGLLLPVLCTLLYLRLPDFSVLLLVVLLLLYGLALFLLQLKAHPCH